MACWSSTSPPGVGSIWPRDRAGRRRLRVLSGREWARWVAILAVGLNAIAQLGFSVAFPLWTLLMIALDVIVIYGLAAGWDEAT